MKQIPFFFSNQGAHKTNFNSYNFLIISIKIMSILTSAAVVPFLIRGHGMTGFARYSMAIALVNIIASLDFGIGNLLNSTSKYDKNSVSRLIQLTITLTSLLAFIYTAVSMTFNFLFSKHAYLFGSFKIELVFLGSFVTILNNFGMKFLLMNGRVMYYQLIQPTQQILASLLIFYTSSILNLEMVFLSSILLGNFFGIWIAITKINKIILILKVKEFHSEICSSISSLATFQYLQLLAIFNTQGMILLISKYFSLEIVGLYSISARIYQSVNQIYLQLIADYWNRVSRLKLRGELSRLYFDYIVLVKKSVAFGFVVNGIIFLISPILLKYFFRVDYNWWIFLSSGLFWTCMLVFIPISHTFNGLLYSRGQVKWQTIFTVCSVSFVAGYGILKFPLSLALISLSFCLLFLVFPLSNRDLKGVLNFQSESSVDYH